MQRFELYKDIQGQCRWRMVARNGKVIADSAEAYASPGNVRKAVCRVIDAISTGGAQVVEHESLAPARKPAKKVNGG